AESSADSPEDLLGSYDIVFAKARCAMEALAVGCSVVLCDAALGLGPIVTSSQLERLAAVNFGRRALTEQIGGDALAAVIRRYDARDATLASERFRVLGSLDKLVDRMLV